ncbi:hypothetical protein F5B22DRAFT_437933 [Xylaria bambusicola]|uniref:uncharacterized protein n=1 Tax=Xylaria bambusicola TaxID=326684 RepID=UPI002007ECE4|nr:uncharacterized protein F5B22DRAFT_437933 [Xylaria bambusicola]KAI0506804.1 hypothetical protein F5B22DRAFT_437933 [Xylaria bambusicola]
MCAALPAIRAALPAGRPVYSIAREGGLPTRLSKEEQKHIPQAVVLSRVFANVLEAPSCCVLQDEMAICNCILARRDWNQRGNFLDLRPVVGAWICSNGLFNPESKRHALVVPYTLCILAERAHIRMVLPQELLDSAHNVSVDIVERLHPTLELLLESVVDVELRKGGKIAFSRKEGANRMMERTMQPKCVGAAQLPRKSVVKLGP